MDKKQALNEREPENAPGDFYVMQGCCLQCGAPQAAAPDLIAFSDDRQDDNTVVHCYFKRQPVTAAEVDQSIEAMRVSCIEALRYSGSDADIVKKLQKLKLGRQIDK
jgi:hypothetical protein